MRDNVDRDIDETKVVMKKLFVINSHEVGKEKIFEKDN
jgi:hypothetical protein